MNRSLSKKKSHIVFAVTAIIAVLQWHFYNIGLEITIDGITTSSFTVTVITVLSSTATWLMISWAHATSNNKIKISNILNLVAGSLCGLLITPSIVGWIGPMAGIIIGVFAGMSCYAAFFIRNKESLENTCTLHVVIRGVIWYAIVVVSLNFWFAYSIFSF